MLHASYSRRGFLRVGALTLGGLSIGDVLRPSSAAPATKPKSVIMIHLCGGPSHLDMYDMKPDAPAEYRGEFQPIATNVPGVEICELMPRQARIADRFAILRGVQLAHLHSANEFYSGFPWQELPRTVIAGEAQRPALGAVVSRMRAAASPIPPYVSLENNVDWERAYYLGGEYEPFRFGGNSAPESLANMGRSQGIERSRLDSRASLLHAFDGLRRDLDAAPQAVSLDALQSRALDIVTSGAVREAFEVEREPPAVRDRYGEKSFTLRSQSCIEHYHQREHPGRSLLQARRLIEAGVSVVTYCSRNWDTHGYNFQSLRALLPHLDQAVAALIGDLEERGLLETTCVLMGGEFGRTPRIGDAQPDGRGHWPDAGFLWIAGGGLRTGQVVGETDARGERAIGDPIRMQHVLATIYELMGIDPSATFRDFNGRPQYVLEDRKPIEALL